MTPQSIEALFQRFGQLLGSYKARELTKLFYRRCLLVDPSGVLTIQMHEELFPHLDTLCIQLRQAKLARLEFEIEELAIHPSGLARCQVRWLGFSDQGYIQLDNTTHYELVEIDGKVCINLVMDQLPSKVDLDTLKLENKTVLS